MRRSAPLLALSVAASLAVGGCATRAPAKAPAQVAAADGAAAAADAVECHLEEVTGSHFKTRVCLTAGQKAMRDAHTQVTKDALTQPRGALIYCPAPKPGGGC